MDKQIESNISTFAHRRLSHVKIVARLLEHELAAGKGSKDVTIERDLLENVLDSLEMYVEDLDEAHTGKAPGARGQADGKPAVTRLN